ncbi:MAG: S26 family signal peptidase [Treponema sp.]|jgi:signal peptidase I|nr:S26 family signal peptidase [Treponema sp.]
MGEDPPMARRDTQKLLPGIAAAFVVALGLKLFLFDFMIAEGSSMSPAIRPGTILVISRLRYGFRLPGSRSYLLRWDNPAPGEVVVFYTPEDLIAVKRCAGLTGKGDFIALGDNGVQSFDSRSYGPVPADNIIGKVLGIK